MSLTTKWFAWFMSISLYVGIMGGIFYYNIFKWTFDEKLKQDAIDMVHLYAPTLLNGLGRSHGAISMDEFDIITRLAKDPRVVSMVYLNKFGDVRWFKDPSKFQMPYDEFSKEFPPPTDAVDQAMVTKTPVTRAVPNMPIYDIAIPLALPGEGVLGLLEMQVSRESVSKVIGQAMRKYALGAAGVLLLMGVCLFFFMHYWVVSPLLSLRDAVEAISFKTLEIKFPKRADEIGDIAAVLGVFLGKIRQEMASTQVREKARGAAEANWWKTILSVLVAKSHKAIVVDEDNAVLYTNFPVTGAVGPEGKTHLLDVVDNQQQDVLRLVGLALERPNQVVETDTLFRSEACHVRAVHLEEEGELRRTLILFEPKMATARL